MKIEELKGKRAIVSAHTITAKDENGKTIGMIRGIDNLYEIRPNKQFEFHNRIKGKLDRNLYMNRLKEILIIENDLYFLCNERQYNLSEKYAEMVDAFEVSGAVTVVWCSEVKHSARGN